MSLAYGKTTPTSYSDPEVLQVNKCLGRVGYAMRPGSYLVDSYPLLKYVPGYLNELKQFHQEELALFRKQAETVRRAMVCFKSTRITQPLLTTLPTYNRKGTRRILVSRSISLRDRMSSIFLMMILLILLGQCLARALTRFAFPRDLSKCALLNSQML